MHVDTRQLEQAFLIDLSAELVTGLLIIVIACKLVLIGILIATERMAS